MLEAAETLNPSTAGTVIRSLPTMRDIVERPAAIGSGARSSELPGEPVGEYDADDAVEQRRA